MSLRLSSPASRQSPEPDVGALALAVLAVLADEAGSLRPEPIFVLLWVRTTFPGVGRLCFFIL